MMCSYYVKNCNDLFLMVRFFFENKSKFESDAHGYFGTDRKFNLFKKKNCTVGKSLFENWSDISCIHSRSTSLLLRLKQLGNQAKANVTQSIIKIIIDFWYPFNVQFITNLLDSEDP